jgi:hypothetical protein
MRRSAIAGLALLAPAIWSVAPAAAAPRGDQASLTGGVGDGSASLRVTLLHATNGDLQKDGLLARFDASFAGIQLDTSDLNISRGDAQVGYQWTVGQVRFRLMGGATILQRQFSNPSPSAIAGTFSGLRVSGQLATNTTSPLLLSANGSYSTALNAYSVSMQAGWRFDKFNAGVEGGFGGSETYSGRKFGVFLSGIRIGLMSLSTSVGYSLGGVEEEGKDSPYADLGLSVQF